MLENLNKIKKINNPKVFLGIFLLISLVQISSELESKNIGISSPLYRERNFGKISRIYFPNEKNKPQLVIVSQDSISSINISNKKISYQKKLNPNSYVISINQKNTFVNTNKNLDIYRTETGQLINSVSLLADNFHYERFLKVEAIKIKLNTVTVFISRKNFVIQSKKKFIFEKHLNETNTDIFLDLAVDKKNETIKYAFKVNEELFVKAISFDDIYNAVRKISKRKDEDEEESNEEDEENKEKKQRQENIQFEINEKKLLNYTVKTKFLEGYLTADYLLTYNGRNVIGYNLIKNKAEELFSIPDRKAGTVFSKYIFFEQNSVLLVTSTYFYYFHEGKISYSFETKEHVACGGAENGDSVLCFLTGEKNLVKYFVNGKGNIDRKFYNIDSLSKSNDDDNMYSNEIVKLISAASYQQNIFVVVTNNRIIEYKINENDKIEMLGEIENNYDEYIITEIFGYKNEKYKNSENKNINLQDYYTTLRYSGKNINMLKIVKNIGNIIINDIFEIINNSKNKIFEIRDYIINLLLKRKALKNKEKNQKEENNDNEYNYSLFLLTESNLLKVIDLYSGKILFSEQFSPNLRIKLIKTSDNNFEQKYVTFMVGKKTVLLYNLVENKFITDEKQVDKSIIYKDDSLLINEETFNKMIYLLLKSGEKNILDISSFELDYKVFGENGRNAIFINYKTNVVYILKFFIDSDAKPKLEIVNNFFYLNIIGVSNPKISDNVNKHYISEGKIYYKLLDDELYYILSYDLSKSSKNSNKTNIDLILTIINGQTGKIVEERVINNIVQGSVAYVFKENWGIISYTKINKGFKRNEIYSFEILNKNIEFSLSKLLKRAFKNKFKKGENIKTSKPKQKEYEIEFLAKTYIFERDIKYLSVSSSHYNKGNKFIICVLDNDDVQIIDRNLLSSRRPITKLEKGKPVFDPEKNSIYASKELPGYLPLIKLNNNLRFYSDNNFNIQGVKTIQTNIESSFITCLTGSNIICKVLHPDKMYDKLSPEFKKELLFAVCLCFIVFIIFFRKYYKKIEFKKAVIED